VRTEGDIANFETTTAVDGRHGATAEMFLIAEVALAACRLVHGSFASVRLGLRSIKPVSSFIEIGFAIARFAHQHKFGVVEQYQGHGLGRKFHQPPGIPNYPMKESSRDVLVPGVCFTIEPMLNLGSKDTRPPDADGWTVR